MKRDCEKPDGTCYEYLSVACDFHGQEALKNHTGYYAPIKCKSCEDTGFICQNSKKFPVIKCPFCTPASGN